MRLDEVWGLPTVVGTDVTADMLGRSAKTLRAEVAAGTAPVMPLGDVGPGHTYRFSTAAVLAVLGLSANGTDPIGTARPSFAPTAATTNGGGPDGARG